MSRILRHSRHSAGASCEIRPASRRRAESAPSKPAVRNRPRSHGDARNHAHHPARRRVPFAAMSGTAHAIAPLRSTIAAACRIAIAT
jgi:hypothetical protein